MIDPTVYTASKSRGGFAFALTGGLAKMKSKAILNGPQAQLQLVNRRPVFYFYFEQTSSGLGSSGMMNQGVSTSPNEFVLVKTEVKKNARELTVGAIGAFGQQGGVSDKELVLFESKKIAPAIYRVSPREDLEDGEYCFFYGGTTPMAAYGLAGGGGGGKVFDFGVHLAKPKG